MGIIVVEDIILILAGIFAVGMIVLMIKYARFIHSQPKMAEERRKIKDEEKYNHDKKSNNK
ncbi:MAG: hypothetical protein CMH75_06605 [Nitrospina sp.]|nr:hypothetical protein [Nitrospina sp.]|tara:strand:+ start:690 stop:872 length:183 start_codon:yes stop_codon:yes gene_type:complete